MSWKFTFFRNIHVSITIRSSCSLAVVRCYYCCFVYLVLLFHLLFFFSLHSHRHIRNFVHFQWDKYVFGFYRRNSSNKKTIYHFWVFWSVTFVFCMCRNHESKESITRKKKKEQNFNLKTEFLRRNSNSFFSVCEQQIVCVCLANFRRSIFVWCVFLIASPIN